MRLSERADRFLRNFEWRLSLLLIIVPAIGSFALPAWAVRATSAFERHAPFSWVAAGFLGFLLFAAGYALISWARAKWVRAKYDHSLYKRTGFVDPMAATFENKRIFLSDFVLPSDPYIFGKTFINCEIIGPANLFLRGNYQVNEQRLPAVDAVALNGDKLFHNGITVENCTFRACSFKRITLMMLPHEYGQYRSLDWLNWISRPSDEQPSIPGLAQPSIAEVKPNKPSDEPELD